MIVVTTDHIHGKNLETIGHVKGSMVRAKHIGKDIMAGLKSIVGGELRPYTDMLLEAHSIADDRMVEAARELGADAIVNVRYSIASGGTSEAMVVLVAGTAVRFV
ncbi:MAG: heavy metal-binding domain-containing protein [Defluviitaleaceae bacterium]|nr:heavy metal-binding domain-containing protein [Defluviitaleaceae bacterium]